MKKILVNLALLLGLAFATSACCSMKKKCCGEKTKECCEKKENCTDGSCETKPTANATTKP